MNEGVTTEWEAKQNEKADGLAEQGRLNHRPELRAAAEHYGKVATSYRGLSNQLKAYMLVTIKVFM